MNNGKNGGSNYRWYILTLAALTHTFVAAIPYSCMPVLFKEISEKLNLSLVQVGTVWGMMGLASMFVVLMGGLLSDKFGVKRTLVIFCFLVGLAGAARGLSDNFATLSATMFLFGFMSAIIPVSVHKACGVWFSGHHLGLANGIVAMGMGVGATLGTMLSATTLSPLLGGWRNVLFLYGGLSIFISILWLLTRSRPGQVKSMTSHMNTIPFRQSFSRIARIKAVWILGFIMLCRMGCSLGMTGYVPLYLRGIGWSAANADGTLAASNLASMMVAIPVTLLSDKLGSRKMILVVGTLTTAIGVGLLFIVDGAMIWVSVIIANFLQTGFMAILFTMVMEMEGIGETYAGTAMGLILTLTHLGGFVFPPLGNSLASINPGLPFVFWAGLATVALLGFCFLREPRKR